jgi:hypothetical protein
LSICVIKISSAKNAKRHIKVMLIAFNKFKLDRPRHEFITRLNIRPSLDDI